METIVFFNIWPETRPRIRHQLKKHRLIFTKELDFSILKHATVLCSFIHSEWTAKTLAKMPRLKFILTFSTGYDHIDISYCAKKKILVSNVPSYGSHTVAEHAIALMLALTKKIVPSVERTRQGNFSLEGLRTTDVCDKTLGIIGFGKIGFHVAKTAKALGMNVIVYDPMINLEQLKTLDCKKVSLNDLLKKSDIISLHAPLIPKTKHMINHKTISQMKKGALIINTARGGLIDTPALAHAIVTGHIGGAGLDVLEEEKVINEELQLLSSEEIDSRTIIANQILINQPNVLITPHNAFNSKEALERIIDTGIENIHGFLNGKPVNIVR